MSIITCNQTPYEQTILCYNDWIYNHSLKMNTFWEEHVVDTILHYLQPNTDFLDIGANIGLISLGVLLKAKKQNIPIHTVHCFECDTSHFNLLQKNTSNYNNIQLYPFAISNKYELCKMTQCTLNLGGNYIHQTVNDQQPTNYDHPCYPILGSYPQQHVFTPAMSLDSILYQFKNKISVIKIDVEGFELNALNGAIQLIQLHRPILLIEIWEINLDKIIKLLDSLNYHRCNKLYPNMQYDENYIAFPDELVI
jgi:FkbM family methyltransferase